MGKDLRGKELGVGISQREGGWYIGRYTNKRGKRVQKIFQKLQECRTGEPKSKSGYRTIPLTEETIEILRLQKKKNQSISIISIEWREFIFLCRKGTPVKNSTYDTMLFKLCEKADLPKFSMHVLRHTFATRCIEAGMKPKTLQTILGHSNIGITMNLYVHTTEEEKHKEIDEKSRLLSKGDRKMKLGIVGLPNVGKSTLFNSLTKAGAESANYPFCTIDPNVGIVAVPDERLKLLGDMYKSKKVTPAVIEFVDIAGLVKGASKGEGLGNQFLANIREVDAIVHVVRCFEDSNIVHVDGSINPVRDIETINLELIFSDVEILERRIAKVAKQARMDKTLAKELELLEALKAHLEDGKMARTFEVDDDEDMQAWFASYNLLTAKSTIYAANVAEDELANDAADNAHVAAVRELAASENSEVFVICAQIEQEIAELDDDEKAMFLEDLGLKESGLEKLIKASYSLLGLISYLTAGEDETRAWTIKKGTKAPQAAGKIHSDFERGFIRAEVVNYKDLLEYGSLSAAKTKGVVGTEGKEYVVKDGDVMLFLFNV